MNGVRLSIFVCVLQVSLGLPFSVKKKTSSLWVYDCLHSVTNQITEVEVLSKNLILYVFSAHIYNQTTSNHHCWNIRDKYDLNVRLSVWEQNSFTKDYRFFILMLFFRYRSLNRPRSILQYSDMAPTWLSGQNCNFLTFFCLSMPKRDLNTKKTHQHIL